VKSDLEFCNADPNYQYCHQDQKVAMDFLIAGGDFDPRAIFQFDSQTGPVKTRKGEIERRAWIDLSSFMEGDGDGCWTQDDDTVLDPFESDCAETSGYKQIVMGFYSGRGGLNLCELCVPGENDCVDTCYMGHDLDVEQIAGDSCEGTSSSLGVVGMYLSFPVEGGICDKMAVIYNPRWSGADPWQCPLAMPAIVERTALNEWTITTTDGCLISGGASGWDVLSEVGTGNFQLIITTQP
jgi:hypothetical protein